MEFKGSKTEANLMAAFAGESQARNKYTYYAEKANQEGYSQIADLFTETANNEKEHAKLWFKLLHEGDVPSTMENLKDAAAGEREENTEMYPRMAAQAREEGFTRIAYLFDAVGKIEKDHEERYLKLLANVEGGKVFEKEEQMVWICQVCGYTHVGTKAPGACPVCAAPQAKFEIKKTNY